VKLICGDRTYDLLNRVYGGDFHGKGKSAKEIIFNIVQTIAADGTTQEQVPTAMASTQSDGSPFPAKDYTVANKTAYEVISELSQPDFTGDDRTYQRVEVGGIVRLRENPYCGFYTEEGQLGEVVRVAYSIERGDWVVDLGHQVLSFRESELEPVHGNRL